ncbi:hypothetical protein LTR70_001589 [Exophiala xenobiotica]|uniref:Ketoreductase domain-containing protein n=1 Tax=Lithohypha guttulata TaxID=1690604 RepID=A0ABR0KDI7_9EURO|nr:hypothetical protein LTR24_003964 [Lithohypha guttulata]KAK5327966.1 hypothetical protein LTR70_001589 [Exophiala xenobiotica]
MTLAGKVAIVTGASRGIGSVVAVDLAKRGASVCITHVSESSKSKCEALASEVSKLSNGTKLMFVQADVSKEDSATLVVKTTTEAFGDHVDILVNNAAVVIDRAISETTKDDFDRVFHTNVLGPLLMTKALLPHLRTPGRIINVSSVGARVGYANLALYGSSKAGLEGLTRSFAAELGDKGTTVNAVAPGPVQSDMLQTIPDSIKLPQKEATAVQKRFGEAQEIANAVAYLAGPDSSWVSGQVLNLSGGWTMY